MNLIFDEVSFIKNVIDTKEYPDKCSLKWLITKILGYLYQYTDLEKDDKIYTTYVIDILNNMKKLTYPYYQEYKYAGYIKSQAKKILKEKIHVDLKNIKEINITKSEIEIVQKLENEDERKLLFTLYALAKVNNNPSGWVNLPDKNIFEFANLRYTQVQQMNLIHSLYKQGYIHINKIIDKHGYKVELGEDVGNIAMIITDFRDFGKQYLDKYKDGWKMCQCCHKMIKIKGNNQKYCKKCFDIINKENQKNASKTYREKQKSS